MMRSSAPSLDNRHRHWLIASNGNGGQPLHCHCTTLLPPPSAMPPTGQLPGTSSNVWHEFPVASPAVFSIFLFCVFRFALGILDLLSALQDFRRHARRCSLSFACDPLTDIERTISEFTSLCLDIGEEFH